MARAAATEKSIESRGRTFKRKTLIVDAEALSALARFRGISESKAVRQAVDVALAAEEIGAAIRELQERGGIDDVLGKMPPDDSDDAAPDRP